MLLSNERLRNEAQNTLNKNRVKTDSDWTWIKKQLKCSG